MVVRVSDISTVLGPRQNPLIRFSVSFAEDSDAPALITIHGWLLGPNRTMTPPKITFRRGGSISFIQPSKELMKQLNDFLEPEADKVFGPAGKVVQVPDDES
jgi:hypothetical protein